MGMPWKMAVAAMSMRLAISASAAEQLQARAAPGDPGRRYAHLDAVAAGVVGLVVIGFGAAVTG